MSKLADWRMEYDYPRIWPYRILAFFRLLPSTSGYYKKINKERRK